jgi:hypothetical protein
MDFRYMHTQGYRELRALVETLLREPPPAPPPALIALDIALKLRCRSCGELLDRQLRDERQEFCYVCVDEAPRERTGPR